jgi:hypothetical protein
MRGSCGRRVRRIDILTRLAVYVELTVQIPFMRKLN